MSSVHKGFQVLAGRLATTTTMVSMRSLPAVLGSLSSSSSSSSSSSTTTAARNASSVSATSSSAQAVEDVKVNIPEGIRVEFKYPFLYSFGPLGVKQANLSMFEHVGIRLVNGDGDGDQKQGTHLSFASYTPSGTYSFARGPKWRSQKVPHRLNQLKKLVERDFEGVTKGFQKELELRGLGFRWELKAGTEKENQHLLLNLGFSHQVKFQVPEIVKVDVTTPTTLTLSSVCKQTLGSTAKDLQKLPRKDRYKGKGIFEKGFTPQLKEAKRK